MFRPGQNVLGYEVVRKLGEGAFGAVYLGRAPNGVQVALKTMVASALEHGSRFRREAEALRRVRSENVARLADYSESTELGRVLVMEYIPGELLSSALALSAFSLPECVELGLGLARGLADMHAQGVVHRDIKPSNIMLRPTPEGGQMPVIFDLGLARLLETQDHALDPRQEHTGTGAMVAIGTPAYMAPEQVIYAAKAMPVADVYALGVCLFRAASGRLPFEGDDREVSRRKLVEEPPALPLSRNDEFGLRYAALVHRCLARRASERFQDGQALVEALMELSGMVAHVPKHARITSGTLSRVQLPGKRVSSVSGMFAPGESLAFRQQKSSTRPVLSQLATPASAARPETNIQQETRMVVLVASAVVAVAAGVWLGLR